MPILRGRREQSRGFQTLRGRHFHPPPPECLGCGRRFTTYETVESLPIVVVKKDGRRQTFDRNKVLNGMVRACEKRPVPVAKLEAAAAEIEQIVQNSLEREVKSDYIGELVRSG